MNQLGVHALVWTGDWSAEPARRAVESTAAAGYDLLELSLPDLRGIDTGATMRLLGEAGLGPACSRGLSFDADPSSADPEVSARGERLLAETLAVTVESFSSAVVSPGLSSDLAIWRNLWDDGADLAAHARRFIAGHLAAARH